MKVMKAMKKLKFWSRKKKKKKTFLIQHPPPPAPAPPPCHCQYQYYYPYEPSAPPLPISSSSSWVEYDNEAQDSNYANSQFISFTSSSQAQAQDPAFGPQDFNSVPELGPQEQDPRMPAAGSTSYQQYMVPNPVYGLPVVPDQVRRERRGGAFGCMFAYGVHLFRCIFPCFHIREINKGLI